MSNKLWLEKNKNMVKESIRLLKKHEPPEGYFLAFSGGKDSVVTYDIVKRAKVKFQAYFNRTSVDPLVLIRFIKENFPDTVHLRPKLTMFQLIVKKKMLPTRMRKFCCEHLKHYAGKGRFVVTGIRAEESHARADRNMVEGDKYNEGKKYIHPIFYWNELDVWEHIDRYRLPVCPLYDDEDCTRIGCVGCPCQGTAGMERDFKRYPKIKKAYIWAIQQLMDNNLYWRDFDSAEDVLNWWIMGNNREAYFLLKRIEAAYKNNTNICLPPINYDESTLFKEAMNDNG